MPASLDVVLGLDLGTSGVKVVALSAAGEVVAQALRHYPLLTPKLAGRSSAPRTGRRPRWRRWAT